MLGDGLVVMLLGVGFVFAFLALLILCLQALGRIVMRWETAHPSEVRSEHRALGLNAVAAIVATAITAREREETP
jgi:sodium pump decarboxylase gamma subunit